MEPQNNNPYPYNYLASPGNTPQSDPSRKRLILALVIIAIFMIACIVISVVAKLNPPQNNAAVAVTNSHTKGTVDVALQNLPDTNTLAVSINNKPLPNLSISSSDTFSDQLAAGNYSLQVTKLGYTSFSVQFSVTSNKITDINVNLQPAENTTITSWDQLGSPPDPALWDAPSFIKTTAPNISIVTVTYFYNKTWAVVETDDGITPASAYDVAGGGGGYEIAENNFSTDTWAPIAGTSEFFANADVLKTPPLVQSYLVDNQLAYPGT